MSDLLNKLHVEIEKHYSATNEMPKVILLGDIEWKILNAELDLEAKYHDPYGLPPKAYELRDLTINGIPVRKCRNIEVI